MLAPRVLWIPCLARFDIALVLGLHSCVLEVRIDVIGHRCHYLVD